MLFGTKICMLYWREFVISGGAIAGVHCNYENTSWDQNLYALLAELCYKRVCYNGVSLYLHCSQASQARVGN